MAKEDSTNITVTLPVSQVDFLDKLAVDRDLSRSQVVRAAIRLLQEANVKKIK